MYRGSILSFVLHFGVLLGLVFGLPSLPSLFERAVSEGGLGGVIPIEIVDSATMGGLDGADVPDPSRALNPTSLRGDLRAPAVVTPGGPATARSADSGKPNALGDVPDSDPGLSAAADTGPGRLRGENSAAGTPAAPPGTGASRPGVAVAVVRRGKGESDTDDADPTARGASGDGRLGQGAAPAAPSGEDAGTPRSAARNLFTRAAGGDTLTVVNRAFAADRRLADAVEEGRPAPSAEVAARTSDRLRAAAAASHPPALFNLAARYLRGETVAQNPVEARALLTVAAERGHPPSQALLGLMNLTGVGGPVDMAYAAFWSSLARDGGDKAGAVAHGLIAKRLRPDEVIRQRSLNSRWGRLITDLANAASLNRDLQAAAGEGDLPMVLSLLARGADADIAGNGGRTAVINAAWRGRMEIIRVLLERGSDTERDDDDGRTPIIWASINGHVEVVDALVDAGANPDHRDRRGLTALMRAAWNGHTDVVRRLIGAGASVDLRDNNGVSVIDYARRGGRKEIVAALRRAGARQ